jgi:hypothetical protein
MRPGKNAPSHRLVVVTDPELLSHRIDLAAPGMPVIPAMTCSHRNVAGHKMPVSAITFVQQIAAHVI